MKRKDKQKLNAAENLLAALFGRQKARLIIAAIIAAVGLFGLPQFLVAPQASGEYSQYELDARFAPAFAHCSRILDKFYYLNCFDDKFRGSLALAYKLEEKNLRTHEPKRPDFEPDMQLPKHVRMEWAHYLHSGYDRGHVLSNQSMNATPQAQRATFLMSNITPQAPKVNQGVWLEVEKRERFLAQKWHSAQVLNRIIYPAKPEWVGAKAAQKGLASLRQAVPSEYYKAICPERASAVGSSALNGCECYRVKNVKNPSQISANDAKIECKNFPLGG